MSIIIGLKFEPIPTPTPTLNLTLPLEAVFTSLVQF